MSKVTNLVLAYRRHLEVPWDPGVAAIQRIIFAVYAKEDELRLRAITDEFRQATMHANKKWLLIDLTDAFPSWMAANEHREAYFECPSDLEGYPAGDINVFVAWLVKGLNEQIARESGSDTVVALMGVGSLFGIAHVSTVVARIQDAIRGRLLVFFPGEFRPENHTYCLLDARAGWNYLALPLLAND